MRSPIGLLALALTLGACETNDAAAPVDVTIADLAGSYDLLTVSGTPVNELDEWHCVSSTLDLANSGSFEIRHHFVPRVGPGVNEPCSTDPEAFVFDVIWRGEFSNTSTLVVMTMTETEVAWPDGSESSPRNDQLVGEYNPETGRLVMSFPDIWSFNPHGGSGGKISIGSDPRGLGGGVLVFDQN